MMKFSAAPQLPLFLLILCLSFLSGCDNGSSSDGGSGQIGAATALVGPNLNGDNWSGYLKNTHGRYDSIVATIQHTGNRVTIQTSIQSGIGSHFVGTIDSRGRMKMYDTYDNEDWTTAEGPATETSITLEDYVFNEEHQRSDINFIVLKR